MEKFPFLLKENSQRKWKLQKLPMELKIWNQITVSLNKLHFTEKYDLKIFYLLRKYLVYLMYKKSN
jgi:hypothetical protein